jgi:hypothetical protein
LIVTGFLWVFRYSLTFSMTVIPSSMATMVSTVWNLVLQFVQTYRRDVPSTDLHSALLAQLGQIIFLDLDLVED